MNRKWRKILLPIIFVIGVSLFVFGVKNGLVGVMITAGICIISCLITMLADIG